MTKPIYRARITVELFHRRVSEAVAEGTETEVRQQAADLLREYDIPAEWALLKIRILHAIHHYKDYHKEEIFPCSLEWHLSQLRTT